ncbi:MAG: hypothetical protein QHH24_08175 [Candidatus Bathyarchaeota archaeon]|jgi:hypothetical protein|nr:hypothetical protein [Candidatus Bathyarchaeota archaeon]
MKTTKEELSGKRRMPKWWKQFWIGIAIAVSVLVVAQYATYLLGYIDLYKLCGGLIVLFLSIPLAYTVGYIKIEVLSGKTRMKLNRIAFIGAGACVSFLMALFGAAFFIWALGLPPLVNYMGQWPTLILFFIAPPIVGAFIGDWIGRRRNYRPYL